MRGLDALVQSIPKAGLAATRQRRVITSRMKHMFSRRSHWTMHLF